MGYAHGPIQQFKQNRPLVILFFLLFIAVVTGLIFIFRYFFWPFLFAIILYLALRPVNDRIQGMVKSRGLSATLVILLLFIMVLFPLVYLLVSIGEQSYQLYVFIQEQINAGLIFLLLGSIQAFGLAGLLIGPTLLTLFHSFWEIYRIFMEIPVSESPAAEVGVLEEEKPEA